jgi:hypothetical protein
MPINQIFKNKVPKHLILDVLSNLNVTDFADTNGFTYKMIDDTIEDILVSLKEIKPYYIPCKCKIYFTDTNSKKIITIIRQLLKLYNFTLITKEKYCRMTKTKYTEFFIHEKKAPKEPNLLLSFF